VVTEEGQRAAPNILCHFLKDFFAMEYIQLTSTLSGNVCEEKENGIVISFFFFFHLLNCCGRS